MKICLNTGITANINVYSTIRPYFTKEEQYQALIYHNSNQKRIENARNLTGSVRLEFFTFESFVVFCQQSRQFCLRCFVVSALTKVEVLLAKTGKNSREFFLEFP